jgi:hypothetical protein
MFIKYEKRKNADGLDKTYVRVVEGYRDAFGVSRMRSIKSYGILEDQKDPESFIKHIEKEIETLKKEHSYRIVFLVDSDDNKNNALSNKIYNYGYHYLLSVYNALKLDAFFDDYQKSLDNKIEYQLKDIFKFYTLERILHPDSKRASITNIDRYYKEKSHFSLADTYRSFDLISPLFDSFQTYLRKNVDELIAPNYSRIFYDVTNYYCEIDLEDGEENLRHRGVSKEHRVDPIIGLGLFMDSNGLPIQIKIFNGNISESKTFLPGISELKKKHQQSRIIMVADKGLNTKANIDSLTKQGDGYIFSQIIKGKKGARYHHQLFDEAGWINVSSDYRYKLYEENGQKILLYWSQKEAHLQKEKRNEKISKALNSLTNGAFGIRHGYEKYLKDGLVNENTGEYYSPDDFKKDRRLDSKKIKEDELYDGYQCLITSELDYTEKEIRKYYHELWEIEETFRITKTDLEFRPIYHYKKEHIMAHFMLCYTSLLILRLFQYKLKESGIRLSPERIIRVLNKMNLDKPSSGYVHLHQIGNNDEVYFDYLKINSSFKTNYNVAYDKEEKFNKYLRSLIFA